MGKISAVCEASHRCLAQRRGAYVWAQFIGRIETVADACPTASASRSSRLQVITWRQRGEPARYCTASEFAINSGVFVKYFSRRVQYGSSAVHRLRNRCDFNLCMGDDNYRDLPENMQRVRAVLAGVYTWCLGGNSQARDK